MSGEMQKNVGPRVSNRFQKREESNGTMTVTSTVPERELYSTNTRVSVWRLYVRFTSRAKVPTDRSASLHVVNYKTQH